MKLVTIPAILILVTLSSAIVLSAEKNEPPRIDVEMVWGEIYQNKTDVFVLITNPNDFDVYVGKCKSSMTSVRGEGDVEVVHHGDGCPIEGPKDFFLVSARAHRLLTLLTACPLQHGMNRFNVHLSSWADAKIKLPPNYVVIGNKDFEFTIINPDSLSR